MRSINELFQTHVTCTKKRTAVYSIYCGKRESKSQYNFNLNEIRTNGLEMSYQTKKRIKDIIESWTDTLDTPGQIKETLQFITMTLPAKQKHEDAEINKSLNRYLYFLKRKTEFKTYLWIAEKQKNGNIHYHVLIDKKVPHQTIRRLWNHEMKKLGYITDYRNNQLKWHQKGFKVRPELLQKWNEEKQLKAYQKGMQENWTNPNSTDIHSLKKIKNVKAYVTKYMTKGIESDKLKEADRQLKQREITSSQHKTLREEIIKTDYPELIITTRKWNCSNNLKKIKPIKTDVGNEIHDIIEEIEQTNPKAVYRNDYVTILKSDIETIQKHSPTLAKKIEENIQKNREIICTTKDKTLILNHT